MLSAIRSRASQGVLQGSQIMRNAVRNSGHDASYPGSNLPFDITNRYKLTIIFGLFFGSSFGAPFFILRHQLLKGQD